MTHLTPGKLYKFNAETPHFTKRLGTNEIGETMVVPGGPDLLPSEVLLYIGAETYKRYAYYGHAHETVKPVNVFVFIDSNAKQVYLQYDKSEDLSQWYKEVQTPC
jgi:hypothetical protein